MILVPGRNCWRLERAGRLALIVDAAQYFAVAKAAIRKARRTVLLVGWQFDLRIRLEQDRPDASQPDELGRFLKAMAAERPELRIHILQWDGAMLTTLSRQVVPFLALELFRDRRIRYRLDSDHPTGACHHQKILVVDDSLAFCGGIDMTADRWDTRAHRDDSRCRVRPDGSPYGPFHDATIAVDGDAARALGELARDRWHRATGNRLPGGPTERDLWPDTLEPDLRDVAVAIARTQPKRPGRPAVHEIACLYEDALRAARRSIYCETQYLASAAIGEILAERLAEPDGPDVVIVNPRHADGWLEEEAMDSARALLVDSLRRADRHGRFRLFYPVTTAGEPIYVHAKVLVIDDGLLRVGSSNLNNRSLGFDTECDLALEAPAGPGGLRVRGVIAAFRDGLLAEHLGTSVEAVAAAIRRHGSLALAVDDLRSRPGRTLQALEPETPTAAERMLVEARLADPERPGQGERRLTHALKRLALAPKRVLADATQKALARIRASHVHCDR